MATQSRHIYDIFLSFNGEDTCKGFVDRLRHALHRRGITTFRVDSNGDLPRGKAISAELIRAMEESRYVLVIFSEKYASSTLCMEEVAKIVECKDVRGGSVIPIYYKVNPSDIREIKGCFERDFAIYQEKYKEDPQKLEKWKAALYTVASLAGRDLNDRYEPQAIQQVVMEIENRLGPRSSYAARHLVGIGYHVGKVVELSEDANGFSTALMSNQEIPKSSRIAQSMYTYDVFLSFRGEDVRKNFVDHLRDALHLSGITTFRDDSDCDLPRGKAISPQLIQAIVESRCVLVIFSENFASSTWCLEEVAKIVECRDLEQGLVLPIFYKVNPSDIRKIKGNFERDFALHQEKYKEDPQKLEKWKAALYTVASLAGRDLNDGYESEFIQQIVKEIENRLDPGLSYVATTLVGIESRVAKVFEKLCLGESDVRIIGICGMGGIGKTSIARAVYDDIYDQFEGSSFLANVRELSEKNGLMHIQNQLLHDIIKDKDSSVGDVHKGANMIKRRLKYKKVLLVLDDVNEGMQLEKLAGGSNWFGYGSRIIITTRHEHLLHDYGVNDIYKAEELTTTEALKLFSLKAFKSECPHHELHSLSEQVVTYAAGLPLALKVLGSLLRNKTLIEWRSALAKLQKCPNKEIFNRLKISYDELEENEKEIFLDIACFFNGMDKTRVVDILESCGLYLEIGIRILLDRSLVTEEDNTLHMHDLLQEMGRQIVHQESPEEPVERSRVWHLGDLYHILTKNTGSAKVRGIVLQSDDLWLLHKYEQQLEFLNSKSTEEGACVTIFRGLSFLKARRKEIGKLLPLLTNLSGESFTKMTNLRLLCVSTIHLSSRFEHNPNELRLLTWDYCRLKSLPSSFHPQNLLELNMHRSLMRKLWRGKKDFKKLKVIDLSHSEFFTETPNFKDVLNLERLILKGCKGLHRVHPSLGVLRKLTLLDLSCCDNLKSLPNSVGDLTSLKVLKLCQCSYLEKLPESIGLLKCLEELHVGGTAITYLPPRLATLEKLKILRSPRDQCEGTPPRFMQHLIEDRMGPRFSDFAGNVMGMQSRVEVVINHLRLDESDVCSIGICGMAGMGKTTIARAIYDTLRWQFEGSSFLANVREVSMQNGHMHLQNQLLRDILQLKSLNVKDPHRGADMIKERLRHKKVFLILDDVDDKKQLEYLAGDPSWFGKGSRISYEGLHDVEKAIFLDIACFFKGKDKCYVMKVLGDCGFNPEIGIPVLIDKSLITIENNKLWMHNLLQEMARHIVHQEYPAEPGKRSRVWLFEDLCHILAKNSACTPRKIL